MCGMVSWGEQHAICNMKDAIWNMCKVCHRASSNASTLNASTTLDTWHSTLDTWHFHLQVRVLQSLLLPVLLPVSAVASVAGLTCKCLESGSVLVVRTDETSSWHQSAWPYIALDKGIKMKDERWKMKDERWKMKDERWSMRIECEVATCFILLLRFHVSLCLSTASFKT